MKRKLVFILLSAFILTSCGDNKGKDLQKIKDLEKSTMGTSAIPIDVTKAKAFVDACVKFGKDYPSDSNSVNLLFEAANISMNIGKAQLSVELFDQIMKDYPSFKKVANCMFLKAFVYDDKLKDLSKAREVYKAFIAKYPTHEFANDAKACLNNLGKTPDQLIKEFEAKQKNDSLAKK